ncbi:MAG: V-type ATPase subunit [bacterium]
MRLQSHNATRGDTRYAYACGVIRALEMRLLGKQRLERLAEARDVDEAMRLLSDTDYAKHFENISDLGYYRCLENELRSVLTLVDKLSVDPRVSEILRIRFDFHNLKVVLREKIGQQDLSSLYLDYGCVPSEVTRSAVKAETLEILPDYLSSVARQGLKALASTSDPAEIDATIDKSMYATLLERVRIYRSPYLEYLVRTLIDLANIRIFLRARYHQIEPKKFAELLIEDGLISTSLFRESYLLSSQDVRQRFDQSPYRAVFEIGIDGIETTGSFSHMEREIDNHLLSVLKLARYFTFGLEVVIAYALIKENEIRNLRLILAAKEHGIEAVRVKERIAVVD